ncbi:MAG: ankyrin repeat domain-containing protein, partial [Candidatus Hydrogenedentes bacterium]|nr:ankyrin repeat domain-containing protein [Candidatus Hydrogenedentota bacterium]
TWNTCSGRADTELHMAIRDGHREMVEAMLALGANVNETTASGMTPLHWCALTGRADLVEVLIEYGANTNVHAPGLGGLTPKATAMLMGYHELADLLGACGGRY